MKTIAFTVAAAALLLATPIAASAAPYRPHPSSAAMRHEHNGYGARTHRTTKADRQERRRNTRNFGNPNSRNPSQEGYQQQLGSTTNGPRY